MRNTLQYPITLSECILHIEAYGQRELNSGAVGGTGPHITTLIAEFLDGNQEFEVFLREKHKELHGIKNENVSPEILSGILKTT